MRIRILDRILVALAGLILLAACAGAVAQVFFSVDVIGTASKLLPADTTTRRIIIGAAAGILLLLGLYCVLMLFRHRKRKDKFVVQKLESGDLAISLKTLETMVQKCVDQHKEIKTESIRLENQRDGLLIRIRGTVAGGISIPLTVDTLQKQVKQYVTACSGVEVKGIRIQIESSGEDAKDAPFLIEPPVNNLLPKGSESPKEAETAEPVPETTAEIAAEPQPAVQEAAVQAEETAAAAVMAAAVSMIDETGIEDDRPIHQQLFSTQEEPCIMPMPPENIEIAEETRNSEVEAAAEDEKTEPAETAEEAPAEDAKGEEEE